MTTSHGFRGRMRRARPWEDEPPWKCDVRNLYWSVLTGAKFNLNPEQAYRLGEWYELGQESARREIARHQPRTVAQRINEHAKRCHLKHWELCELITNWRTANTTNKKEFVDTQLRAIRKGNGGVNARRDVDEYLRYCEQHPGWLEHQLEAFSVRRTLDKTARRAKYKLLSLERKQIV